jgi:hypothetical protein
MRDVRRDCLPAVLSAAALLDVSNGRLGQKEAMAVGREILERGGQELLRSYVRATALRLCPHAAASLEQAWTGLAVSQDNVAA